MSVSDSTTAPLAGLAHPRCPDRPTLSALCPDSIQFLAACSFAVSKRGLEACVCVCVFSDLRCDGPLLQRDPLLHDGPLLRVRGHEFVASGIIDISSDCARLVDCEITVLQRGDLTEGLARQVSGLLVLAFAEVDGLDLTEGETQKDRSDSGMSSDSRHSAEAWAGSRPRVQL